MPRLNDITLSLVGFEEHKAKPDFSHDSGFWLRVSSADASPFIDAFRTSPTVYHEFCIEQRVGKETRVLTMMAQIVKIEQGPAETLVQIEPDPSYGPNSNGIGATALFPPLQRSHCPPLRFVPVTRSSAAVLESP